MKRVITAFDHTIRCNVVELVVLCLIYGVRHCVEQFLVFYARKSGKLLHHKSDNSINSVFEFWVPRFSKRDDYR